MNTYAAVDLGATSGRVLTGRLAGGRLDTTEVARFENAPVGVPAHGREVLHWDVLALWAGIRRGLDAAHRNGGFTSVGVDTWAVDYGLLDADGALLGSPVHYRDERTLDVPEQFFTTMPASDHYAVTGAQVQPFNTVFQLLAAARTTQLASAAELLLVPDLLAAWLSGVHVAEVTNASTTGLLDVDSRSWSHRILRHVEDLTGSGITALLPRLVEPGTVLGPLRPGLGWGDASVVAVGSHDTASAVAAVPMLEPEHAAYISSGTWSLVGVELPGPVRSEPSRLANVTNELGVDGTVRYLKNVAGLWLLSESQRTWAAQGGVSDLAALLAAAAHVPVCRTVVDVDDPAFAAPGDIPARIAAAASASGQPVPDDEASTTRCILDSLALAYRRAIRTVAGLADRDVRVVHVVGGGSRNALLCQLTADATGLPVVAGPAECTAMGNLLVQAWAMGDLDGGLPAIRQVVADSTELARWNPAGDTTVWDQADDRLRDLTAARL
ncbi:rhamnulokinase [Cellulomonas fimi]|uniref:Carbohydrate kinase, FGGY-like protein n=1 Tax=Cellulomonas fimi (strain ATCC 484 / DSM 20113 / JCM 1341 / CCUG 24087 / LMG 16345 / NBRC 15513 / NCIMB 8980 / NCTC 7547 / NRS-133) TaxID=590998 RepID=F4GYL3_CELFA|nr:rhamnulokinase family protein [Cellulomonas fimi]AEE47130.1 Carbohydrate kinase, FGGY-like protein [Cellulomonas fimi ATCC 484]NNH05622.1 rhamnulokinase [Cellulomonas fimi]VEH35343.1 Rhamnulokinase [Cellulomonas fimi]